MTDEELVKSVQTGNTNAFRELVKRHESRVAATVIGMLGHCPEADDVGQETFIRFYRGIKNFRGQSTVGTYLTRIAINLSLNELKRRKRKKRLFFYQGTSNKHFDLVDDSNSKPYSDEVEVIQRAVQKLKPKFRSVIILRLIDGYSTAETAEILNVPIGTVLSRLARAQKKLQEILSPYLGDSICVNN